MLPAKELLLDSVDDYLGPGEKRFFGSGFRRVQYRYDKVEMTGGRDLPTELGSRLDVVYPADWSTKAKTRGDLRPHLSTVDGLIIAVHMSETALTHALGLGPESRRAGRVLSVRIKAGTGPDEELTGLPVRTTVLGVPVPDREGEAVSRLQTMVGAMRVRTDLRHPLPEPAAGAAAASTYTGPAELLGPVDRQYYGTGFAARTQSVRKVAVRVAEARAHAVVDVAQEPGTVLATEGTEGLYQPFVGLIDTFVTSLQLGQILLYETDGISRGSSNTLWMRTTAMKASAEPDPIRYETPLDVRLENSTLLRRDEEIWRAADIVGQLAGNTVRCSIAHRLPG
ncbi:AvrD family protein [Streptomyces sp. NBC_00287]|uniref:AvrD family protein n=1 Tax=Streptomyces sp. NBC_00287 TaxID=2975702 RepID=UPI002E2967C1|nr:AvrD family protein [Streptomyces sp. NBC_00287]